MSDEMILSTGIKSLSGKLGAWFFLWQLPMFKSLRTQVTTQSWEDDGRYSFPLCLGERRFTALIQGVHPTRLTLEGASMLLSFDLSRAEVHILPCTAAAEPVAQLVRQRLLTLRKVPVFKVPTIGYDYHDIHSLAKSAYWFDKLWFALSDAFPGAVVWVDKGSCGPMSGELPAGAQPELIIAGDEERFIVYDTANDRLTGSLGAPDIRGSIGF